MKNMKIAAKLMVSFAIVALVAAIVGVVGIYGIKSIDNSYTLAYTQQTVPLPNIAKTIEFTQRLRVQFRNLILHTGDAEALKAINADVADRMAKVEEYMAAYDVTIVNPEARIKFDEAKKIYVDEFKPILIEVQKGANEGKPQAELMTQMETATAATNIMVDNFSRCMDIKVQAASDNSDKNTVYANLMLTIMVAVVVVGVVIAMVLGVYIARLIGEPVKRMRSLMEQIGTSGNLEIDPALKSALTNDAQVKDEIGESVLACNSLINHITEVSTQLSTIADGDLTKNIKPLSANDTLGVSLLRTQDSLNKMFSEINSSSNQVSQGSVQIADGAQLLAQGATEQSATVEELSASIAEIAEQTKQNAGTANEAKDLGENIKNSAERGSRQMEQMMAAVQEINESSKSIGKVIKIIDDIAFQTNILALNAAVEAARAGQHGKGFAVVADEVRSLAAKSAEAAKNTNELIESSIQKAEMGASISEETSVSLQQIVEGILHSSELIAEISKSSNEQTISISQISEAIDQVSQVVQQNSATAEESAAASEEMSGQATLLQQLIAQFKLKGSAMGGQATGFGSQPAPKPMSMSTSTGYSLDSSSKY